jgi:hypothetical protein
LALPLAGCLKVASVIALLFLGCLEALPQGQIIFNNRVSGIVVAPIYGPEISNTELVKHGNTSGGTPAGTQSYSGQPLQSVGYTAQLFGGPTNTPVANLAAINPATSFGISPNGFVEPPDFAVSVPGVPEGTPALIQLRVWDNDNGTLTNWNQVRTNTWVARGQSLPFVSPPLGGSVTLPPNLEGLRSFNIALPAGASALTPGRPVNLQAATASDTQIDLSWQDTSTNESGFRIERSLDGLRFSNIGSTTSNVTSYSSGGLRPNTRYYYRVRAFNGVGESAYSNTNFGSTRTPFAQWQLGNFSATQLTNASVAGPAADPDNDSLPNVFEHALARAPLQPDNQHLATAVIDERSDSNYLAIEYSRSKGAIDVNFNARVSSNLVSWQSNVVGPNVVAETTTSVTERFRDTVAISTTANRFLDLVATHTGVRDYWE